MIPLSSPMWFHHLLSLKPSCARTIVLSWVLPFKVGFGVGYHEFGVGYHEFGVGYLVFGDGYHWFSMIIWVMLKLISSIDLSYVFEIDCFFLFFFWFSSWICFVFHVLKLWLKFIFNGKSWLLFWGWIESYFDFLLFFFLEFLISKHSGNTLQPTATSSTCLMLLPQTWDKSKDM